MEEDNFFCFLKRMHKFFCFCCFCSSIFPTWSGETGTKKPNTGSHPCLYGTEGETRGLRWWWRYTTKKAIRWANLIFFCFTTSSGANATKKANTGSHPLAPVQLFFFYTIRRRCASTTPSPPQNGSFQSRPHTPGRGYLCILIDKYRVMPSRYTLPHCNKCQCAWQWNSFNDLK